MSAEPVAIVDSPMRQPDATSTLTKIERSRNNWQYYEKRCSICNDVHIKPPPYVCSSCKAMTSNIQRAKKRLDQGSVDVWDS